MKWLIHFPAKLSGIMIFTALLFLISGKFEPVLAAEPGALVILNSQVSYVFGDRIILTAEVNPQVPVSKVNVLLRVSRSETTFVGDAEIDLSGKVVYEHDLSKFYFPAYSDIEYWYVVELSSGSLVESETFTFYYDDNRFTWQSLEKAPFRVHWYSGDLAFSQFVLDMAHTGAADSQKIIGGALPDRVDIYLYKDEQDYKSASGQLVPDWAGGHTDPAAGVIVVYFSQSLERKVNTERKIPHEIAHIMLYQIVGNDYDDLPKWLVEGLATFNEVFQSSDYIFEMQAAYETNKLLSMNSLCSDFPGEDNLAFLAYAESGAFVQYLIEAYGTTAFNALIENYTQGVSCENGPKIDPYNKTLSDLYQDWRGHVFGETALTAASQGVLPWIIVAGAVFAGPIMLIIGSTIKRKDLEKTK